MSAWLQRQWYRIGVWHLVLIPLSWLFGLFVFIRRYCYRIRLFRSYKLPVPVIVVGNISAGGTGKTPVVIWLAEKLQSAGLRPGIISRGYGATGNGQDLISVTAKSDPRLAGDEPVLIAQRIRCPVWVGRDRVAAARALLAANPECDIIISDDGLQHYRLQRDFEIAVMDGDRKFGNAQLLPAGPLREPESRMEAVDAIIVNGIGEVSGSYGMKMESMPLRNLLAGDQAAGTAHFQGKDIHAIAGIGNPDRFFSQLERLGLIFKRHRFADHHAFILQDLQSLDAEVIVMTEKDAVKCAAFAQNNWWCLPVNAVIDTALLSHIVKKLNLNPA